MEGELAAKQEDIDKHTKALRELECEEWWDLRVDGVSERENTIESMKVTIRTLVEELDAVKSAGRLPGTDALLAELLTSKSTSSCHETRSVARPSVTSGTSMASTRLTLDAMLDGNDDQAKILAKVLELFPFDVPSNTTISQARMGQHWTPSAEGQRRKVDKQDKLVQKRHGLYSSRIQGFVSKYFPEGVPQFDPQATASKQTFEFMREVHQDVTKATDGSGKDLTLTKPYILTLMRAPLDSAVREFVEFIAGMSRTQWNIIE